MITIALNGCWNCGSKTFTVPGSACENEIGTPQEHLSGLSLETARSLKQRFNYVGELYLTRTIELDEDYTEKYAELFLERVNMVSALWIDGEKVGVDIIELSAPHIYDITKHMTKGIHEIKIKLDNSDHLNIDHMGSGYSEDTQGFWIGIIGKAEIRIRELFHIDNIQIYAENRDVDARICVCSDCAHPNEIRDVKLSVRISDAEGNIAAETAADYSLMTRKEIIRLTLRPDVPLKRWNEFSPAIYTMTAELTYDGKTDIYSQDFGARRVHVKDKQFMIDDMPFALRGTLDCAIYPMTGYPPMDLDSWLAVYRDVKSYGMNHVRFHSWCPPEAAFTAADTEGVYISVEMPLWLNVDVCALDTGSDRRHELYYAQEALVISKTYGNHPAFIMFSNGNELIGDFEMLEYITARTKAVDNRRLYTMTSNFDHNLAPCEDYMCSAEVRGHRIRLQVFHDVVSEHTCITYDDAVADTPVPIISFEVGQYCVYPDVDCIDDFTGNMMPVNFEVIKAAMIEKGLYHKRSRYLSASGTFAALMYKEDIEAVLRTHRMGGFEILGLWDYTGQGTATIGILDVFRRSKGILTPEQFRRFCSDTVPLLKTKRIIYSDEEFYAEPDLYNYGPERSTDIEYTLTLSSGGKELVRAASHGEPFKLDMSGVTEPLMITAELSACGRSNSWTLFVYPRRFRECSIEITDSPSGIKELIRTGGKAVFRATRENLRTPVDGLFKPVFWSPAFFASNRAGGLWCDSAHPIFKGFPTTDYADFQWKHPIDKSVGADISSLPRGFDVLLEPVPNFFTNIERSPLFEARIGKADILFCGFDLDADDAADITLRNSIYDYVSSPAFAPSQTLDEDTFTALLND